MQTSQPHVDLLATRSGGVQVAIMRFYLEEAGDVRLIPLTADADADACAELLARLAEEGIRGPAPGARVFPSQGLEFLEALRYHFDGIYLRATQVLR
jgi:hypothetical protein